MDSAEIIDVDALYDGERNEEQVNSAVPIPLTSVKGPGLSTLEVEYVDDLPEYPTTHIYGYTYVVASKGRSQAEMEQVVHDIQYSKKQTQGQKQPVYSPFLKCRAKKWTWKCSGIYACEFLSPDLQRLHHTSVDEEIWQRIQKKRESCHSWDADEGKRNAYSFYRAQVAFFKNTKPCLESLPTCKPVFKRYHLQNVANEYDPYIACIHEQGDFLSKHYRGSVRSHTMLNLQFLEDLFNKNIIPETEECDIFEPLTSRRKYCGRDHPQGSGLLKHTTCSVIFTGLVPVDINSCPYILFTSRGVHQHAPPPPHKPPEKIFQGVKQIIQNMRDPSMTTAQFLRSPQLEAFCQQYNAATLSQIHTSFSNKDRIASVIQKHRLLSYPNGQDVNGVIFLRNTDAHLKEYIQEWYHDSQGTMIFCAFREAIQLLQQLQSFEVDMSYKRIREKRMNEVLFATFMPDQCKIITLLRVFTSEESTEGYYLLFKRAFALIEKISQRPVLFQSIHHQGIYGIIVDMDNKQYTGLGKYLSEIDPEHRDILWHLQRIIVFCRVHFQRTILATIGTQNKGSGQWSVMMNLLDCHSEEEYDNLIECYLKFEPENVRNWAIHKKNPVIKAGLCKGCSKINPVFFDRLRDHTNAVEQSHQKSYATGKYLTLAEAVKNSAKIDQDDIIQYRNFKDFNIHHSYRTSNMEANYLRQSRREGSRGRKRPRSTTSNSRSSQKSQSSECSQQDDNESLRSSNDLRRTAATNALTLEQKRQELELRQFELEIERQQADIEKQKEETREKQLKNEEKELELLERRRKIQEAELSSYQAVS